jgi:hypothetical protein
MSALDINASNHDGIISNFCKNTGQTSNFWKENIVKVVLCEILRRNKQTNMQNESHRSFGNM